MAGREEEDGYTSAYSGSLSVAVADALDPGLFSALFSGLAALPAVPDPTASPSSADLPDRKIRPSPRNPLTHP